MNRIEKVREYVDNILLNMADYTERRCGYIHLYGVAQFCTMIAMKRNENVELATIAGMLHDIYSYSTLDSRDHAHKGSIMASEILRSLNAFDDAEITIICKAIYNHSNKMETNSPFDDVLIDADVLEHCLYNPLFEVAEHEKERFEKLRSEFGI